MEKLNLFGIKKTENKYVLTFEKKELFFDLFSKIFEKYNLQKPGSFYADEQTNKIELEDFQDVYENTNNDDFDLDIIFGNNKIIVIINSKEQNLIQIFEDILNFSDFDNKI